MIARIAALAVALAAAAPAAAVDRFDIPADTAPHHKPAAIQPFVDDTHQWLGREHGLASTVGRPQVISVELWPFRRFAGDEAIYAEAAVDIKTCRISYGHVGAHKIVETMRHAAGVRSPLRVTAAIASLHELLHCHNPRAPEGVVDAVAADLAYGYLRAYTGRTVGGTRNPVGLVQYPQALTVFQRSARAAGTAATHPKAAAIRMHMLRAWR